ncbi:MAG: hypothetical protein HY820_13970 [Acidobacteria bacterium]|nr:hypothetical protein [Acidobacteriota bacterium]
MTLSRSKSSIWRGLLVPAQISIGQLHDFLPIAIGWYNSRSTGQRRIGLPGPAATESTLIRPRARTGYAFPLVYSHWREDSHISVRRRPGRPSSLNTKPQWFQCKMWDNGS